MALCQCWKIHVNIATAPRFLQMKFGRFLSTLPYSHVVMKALTHLRSHYSLMKVEQHLSVVNALPGIVGLRSRGVCTLFKIISNDHLRSVLHG